MNQPPHGLDEMLFVYGNPHEPGFEAQYIEPFALPYPLIYGSAMVVRSRAHKLAVPAFVAVFKEIKAQGLVDPYANEYAGIYAQRPVRGYPHFPSTHSWGVAIDMETTDNALGTSGHMHPAVVSVFKAHGFTWGGDFKSRKDPMHFQYCSGY